MSISLNTLRKTIWVGAMALSIALFQNCGYVATPADTSGLTDPPSVGTTPDSYASLRAGVLNTNCLGCHTVGYSYGDFSTYAGVRAKLTPGNPAGSLFYQKVGPGGNMPPGGMSTTMVTRIYDWIAAGAPETL